MTREKKPVHKVQMIEGKRNIIRQFLEEYDIESVLYQATALLLCYHCLFCSALFLIP